MEGSGGATISTRETRLRVCLDIAYYKKLKTENWKLKIENTIEK